MTATLQTKRSPKRTLDPAVARAQSEGMVKESAKLSAVTPSDAAGEDVDEHDGWSFHASSFARPRAARWQPASIVVAMSVMSVVIAAVVVMIA